MNLNQVTAGIGRHFSAVQDILDPLIKQPKKLKTDETGYVVKIIFDIPGDKIYFKLLTKLTTSGPKEFLYFGNNSAAGFQYYLVRETTGLNYILGSTLSDLYQILLKHNKEKGMVGNLLKRLSEKGFITLANKKGDGRVNLKKLSILEKDQEVKLEKKKSKIYINEKEYSYENFVRLFIGDQNKKNRMVLVVPVVIGSDGKKFILSQYTDYDEIVIKENNLGDDLDKDVSDNSVQRICHICGNQRSDVSSSYSAKFSRSGINKIFTTTTINTSDFNKKYSYDDNYGICRICYNDLLIGEKIISSNFKSRIAGEDVFIIPEGLMGDFDYEELGRIKSDIDLAFSLNKAQDWLDGIDDSYEEDMKYYNVNFLFYRSDGTSVTALETIEDIPVIKFVYVSDIIGEIRESLEGHIKNFTLGNIYSIVPVRTNTKGEQLDIKRVISLYDAILSNQIIDRRTIFAYFTEAMDKGIKQLEKSKIDNYTNLNVNYYKKNYDDSARDFFIKRITMGYLILLKTIEQLGLLSKTIFEGEEGRDMEQIFTGIDRIDSSIKEIETFLEKQNFSREGRALFYLGTLINRVAFAQYKKEHKAKPILKKIQFQGMNQKEILRLYYDVVEKLRQYEALSLYAEMLINRFHFYFEDTKSDWGLDEHSNIFYIMAGYSYMVGRKGTGTEEKTSNLEDNNTDGE